MVVKRKLILMATVKLSKFLPVSTTVKELNSKILFYILTFSPTKFLSVKVMMFLSLSLLVLVRQSWALILKFPLLMENLSKSKLNLVLSPIL